MKTLLVILSFFSLNIICSQNAYYDAVKLNNHIENGLFIIPKNGDSSARTIEIAAYFKIINSYYHNSFNNLKEMHDKIGRYSSDNSNPYYNPFLSAYMSPGGIQSFRGQNINNLLTPQANNTSGSVTSGFNFPNAIDGLTKFMVKRFKEELTIAFFKKFKKSINDNAELKTLFPQTHKTLLLIDKDVYLFSSYLNTLRDAFIKDLGVIYPNFKKMEELPAVQRALAANLPLKNILDNAVYFTDQFAHGNHPGAIIANYDPTNIASSNTSIQKNLRSSVKVLQLISASFKSKTNERYWVASDSLQQFFNNPQTVNLYLGLLYEKSKEYKFDTAGGEKTLAELLDSAISSHKIEEYKLYIQNIIDNTQEINEYMTTLKTKDKKDLEPSDYYALVNSSLDLLQKGLEFSKISDVNIDTTVLANTLTMIDDWVNTAHTVTDLYTDIKTKNYSAAITNLTQLVQTIYGSDTTKTDMLAYLSKYGRFAAEVAKAQTSDEYEKVIESFVLPAGSYTIKRESKFNIALNSYLGFYAGAESMPGLSDHKTAFSSGLTAPVGLAFSWGNLHPSHLEKAKNEPEGKSFTIMLSLIDVGAIAAYRFNDDQTNIASNIELKNVISPGLFFYWGLGKYPISLGLGAQIGPQLRSVSDDAAATVKETDNIYIRYGFSVVVDIPLLNLYTKSK